MKEEMLTQGGARVAGGSCESRWCGRDGRRRRPRAEEDGAELAWRQRRLTWMTSPRWSGSRLVVAGHVLGLGPGSWAMSSSACAAACTAVAVISQVSVCSTEILCFPTWSGNS